MANPDSEKSMGGKTCLVTGATAGIGRIAARELARRGASVVVIGRSPERCKSTVESIRRETGNPDVESLVADLSAQAEVRRLAEEVQARYPRIDVLLNNAGAMFSKRRESVDGIEMTFALNHLGYFLLTNLLLDPLKEGAPARVVNVASEAHRMVSKVDFDDPQGRKKYGGWHAYGQSKFANILFTYELARRLSGTGVTANALHPGFVASNFTEGNGAMGWMMRRFASLFAITPDEGAKTSIHLASSPQATGVTGKYFAKEKPIPSSKPTHDEAAARRLWELSEELTGMKVGV
ncbi:SDR family oxidoreductase [Tundrisphaera lichenicola]|uniref:SDR family oxidoreductase n=1 Tax=Tundrisphaera lichenicola TaxID=2029860 RepID=UPI003EBDB2FB